MRPETGRGLPGARRRQRGVVLLFALISVLIVMIAAVALIRSFNSSLFAAGNIAFKRDLQNESELAVQDAMNAFRTGGALATRDLRKSNLPAANYSAKALTNPATGASVVNPQTVPLALQSDSAMAAAGWTKPSTTGSSSKVTYQYLIERLCDATGDETTLGTTHCLVANVTLPGGQGNDQRNAGSNPLAGSCGTTSSGAAAPCQSAQSLNVVYRVTVRVQGPRNTLSFFQSTITAP